MARKDKHVTRKAADAAKDAPQWEISWAPPQKRLVVPGSRPITRECQMAGWATAIDVLRVVATHAQSVPLKKIVYRLLMDGHLNRSIQNKRHDDRMHPDVVLLRLNHNDHMLLREGDGVIYVYVFNSVHGDRDSAYKALDAPPRTRHIHPRQPNGHLHF